MNSRRFFITLTPAIAPSPLFETIQFNDRYTALSWVARQDTSTIILSAIELTVNELQKIRAIYIPLGNPFRSSQEIIQRILVLSQLNEI